MECGIKKAKNKGRCNSGPGYTSSITYHERSFGFMSKDSTPATPVVRRTMGISQLYQVGVEKMLPE